MVIIPLQAVPNQSFSIRLAGNFYDINIWSIISDVNSLNVIAVLDLTINNVLTLSGFRAVAGFPIIPYQYLLNGNFLFLTMNDDYPDYTQFGITQSLIFASQEELEAISAITT